MVKLVAAGEAKKHKTSKQMDKSFWQEIERARNQSGSHKMTESLRLFDEVAERMLAGIKSQFPVATQDEALHIRRKRIDLIRRLEDL